MKLAAALRELIALGVEGEALIGAMTRLEADFYPEKKGTGAARQARFRAKRKAEDRNESDVSNVTSVTVTPPETKVSPTPLSKTQTLPPSPPKGAHGSENEALAERLWALQPKAHRRSTKPDVRRALIAALKGGTAAEIEAACRAYYARPDCRKDGGEFAMGAARLLQADRWRDFLPSLEPPAAPVTADVLAWRRQHFRETGEWRGDWGDKPRGKAA